VVEVLSSPGLKKPPEGKEVVAWGEYEMIGWVIPKEDDED